MAVGAIRRERAVITIHVGNRPRRFVLRASSVAEHLSFLALRKDTREATLAILEVAHRVAFPTAAAARARETELATLAVSLLQEPADGGPPLFKEDALDLRLGDAGRVLALADSLVDLERVLGQGSQARTLEEVVETWLDVASTIAQARLAPDPQAPLESWSVEQVVSTYWRACRILWREDERARVLAGCKPRTEPDFKPKAKKEVDATKQAFADAHFERLIAERQAANRDPDGRKFPGTL